MRYSNDCTKCKAELKAGRLRREVTQKVAREIFNEIDSHFIKIASTRCVDYATGDCIHTSESLNSQPWWIKLKEKYIETN